MENVAIGTMLSLQRYSSTESAKLAAQSLGSLLAPDAQCINLEPAVVLIRMNSALKDTAANHNLEKLRRSCGYCAMHDVCLPAGLDGEDLEKLDAAVRDKLPLDRGNVLFRQGDSFTSLYVVRTGSLKTYVDEPDGDSQILGFHLPGEIVGISGLTSDHYACSAEALERSSVCEVSYKQLQVVCNTVPVLQHQLVRIISRHVMGEEGHMVMMGKQQAQRRVAIFVRNLADRYQRLSRDSEVLTLPMTRSEIANYLGLVIETVSRLFSRMEANGILAVNRKSVRILRPDLLDKLCGGAVDS